MKHSYFGQKEYGIFTLENSKTGYIGTAGVGPCVALFLYNPAKKECFAIHYDTQISTAAIQQKIKVFLGADQDYKKYTVHFIGGWKCIPHHQYEQTNELILWFKNLSVGNIDTSKLLQYEGNYTPLKALDQVLNIIFDLHTGKISISKGKVNAQDQISARSFSEHLLAAECTEYLVSYGSCAFDASLQNIQEENPKKCAELLEQSHSLYSSICKSNNATPIVPSFDLAIIVKQQLNNLKMFAVAGDALNVIKHLFESVANPGILIPGDRFSVLHYACQSLAAKPTLSHFKQAAILVLLVQSRQDLASIKPDGSKGRTALELLPYSEFKNACQNLLIMLRTTDTEDISLLIKSRELITFVVDDLYKFEKQPELLQERLLGYIKDLQSLVKPESKVKTRPGLQ